MCEQDKSKTHYFLQTHGHIMYQHDTTTSYQGNGTTFFIFASVAMKFLPHHIQASVAYHKFFTTIGAPQL